MSCSKVTPTLQSLTLKTCTHTRLTTRPVLSESDLDEIEALARENESETYRGPLLVLVDEVRRAG